MKGILRGFVSILCLALFGCSVVSNSSESVSESSFSTSEPASDSVPSSIPKDEAGFPILPSSYLSHEDRAHSFGAKVDGVPLYAGMRLYLGDEEVPVYRVYVNTTYRWDPEAKVRTENGVASISISSGAKLTLQTTWVANGHYEILPSAKNIASTPDDNYRTLSFEINQPGDYTIGYRSERTLHLFVHDINEPKHDSSNSMYFGPGLHDRSNDNRLSSDSRINLSSNTKVYLAEGAIVRGIFVANNASNIEICGPGFIDGSVFNRNATTGTAKIPLEFNYCSSLKFSSFAMLDPAGWCFNLYFSTDIELNGVKIISSRSNGDGISLQSCQRVKVSNCFVRTYDDSIVVKNYPRWSDRNQEGTTDDIEVWGCLIWTDLAQCLEVGYETVGQKMENIHFHDITILHANHKAALSIHNANNANIKNVRFEDIRIEHLDVGQGDGSNLLIDFSVAHSSTWSDQHKVTGLGSVDGVVVNNITVLHGQKTPGISIRGSYETRSGYAHEVHKITNVALSNIVLRSERIGTNYAKFAVEYAENITVDGTAI